MLELMIAILLGLASPKHATVPNNGGTAITATGADTNQADDTGGDTGQNPPR